MAATLAFRGNRLYPEPNGWASTTIAILAITGCVLLGSLLFGCAGAQHPTERILSVSARALRSLETDVSPLYRAQHRECFDGAESGEEYDECMEPWNVMGRAALGLREVLLAAESARLAYEAGSGEEGGWIAAVACIRSAAEHLLSALSAVGIDAPSVILDLVVDSGDFLGRCVEA